jgi:protein Mpv17
MKRLLTGLRNLNNISKEIKKLNDHSLVIKIKKKLFSKYLLGTNLLVSMGFSGMGDITEQIFEISSKYQSKWDYYRTLKLTATGLSVGLVCHYWYIYLDKHYSHPSHVNIFKKVLLSQVVFSPICLVVFFSTLGVINRSSPREIYDNLMTKGKRIYMVEWAVWPPASLVNFYLVPLRYRVLYDNVISFGFDVYNSYIVHKHLRQSTSTQTTYSVQESALNNVNRPGSNSK